MFEPTITVVGNVSDVPTLRVTPQGIPVASFRVANTPRRREPSSGNWIDGETVWFGVSAWRQLGEHAATSIKKGDRVVLVGRLTSDTYTAESGEVRSSLKVDAQSIGLELSRGTAVYSKAPRLVTNEEPVPYDSVTGEVFGELEEISAEQDVPVAA